MSPTLAGMAGILLDVTDLVEFLQRQESVSGVQRVIAETAPVMLAADPSITPVLLDRTRGELVPLTNAEVDALLRHGCRVRQPGLRTGVRSLLRRQPRSIGHAPRRLRSWTPTPWWSSSVPCGSTTR